jgi:hypothetical protein
MFVLAIILTLMRHSSIVKGLYFPWTRPQPHGVHVLGMCYQPGAHVHHMGMGVGQTLYNWLA